MCPSRPRRKPQHGGGRGLGGAPALGCPRELRRLLVGIHVRVPIVGRPPRHLARGCDLIFDTKFFSQKGLASGFMSLCEITGKR